MKNFLTKVPPLTLLMIVWAILLVLTLSNALIAEQFFSEQVDPTNFVVLIICATISLKGTLIVDHFMGMKVAQPIFRWLMLSYIYVLPVIIALAVIFPDTLARWSTL